MYRFPDQIGAQLLCKEASSLAAWRCADSKTDSGPVPQVISSKLGMPTAQQVQATGYFLPDGEHGRFDIQSGVRPVVKLGNNGVVS